MRKVFGNVHVLPGTEPVTLENDTRGAHTYGKRTFPTARVFLIRPVETNERTRTANIARLARAAGASRFEIRPNIQTNVLAISRADGRGAPAMVFERIILSLSESDFPPDPSVPFNLGPATINHHTDTGYARWHDFLREQRDTGRAIFY